MLHAHASRPVPATVASLFNYEQLVSAGADHHGGRGNATAIEDIIHRPCSPAGAIEQAKGALRWGLVRCDAGARRGA